MHKIAGIAAFAIFSFAVGGIGVSQAHAAGPAATVAAVGDTASVIQPNTDDAEVRRSPPSDRGVQTWGWGS